MDEYYDHDVYTEHDWHAIHFPEPDNAETEEADE